MGRTVSRSNSAAPRNGCHYRWTSMGHWAVLGTTHRSVFQLMLESILVTLWMSNTMASHPYHGNMFLHREKCRINCNYYGNTSRSAWLGLAVLWTLSPVYQNFRKNWICGQDSAGIPYKKVPKREIHRDLAIYFRLTISENVGFCLRYC